MDFHYLISDLIGELGVLINYADPEPGEDDQLSLTFDKGSMILKDFERDQTKLTFEIPLPTVDESGVITVDRRFTVRRNSKETHLQLCLNKVAKVILGSGVADGEPFDSCSYQARLAMELLDWCAWSVTRPTDEDKEDYKTTSVEAGQAAESATLDTNTLENKPVFLPGDIKLRVTPVAPKTDLSAIVQKELSEHPDTYMYQPEAGQRKLKRTLEEHGAGSSGTKRSRRDEGDDEGSGNDMEMD